ncbi:ABC transporter permease subunit [Paraliobacillus sediminis]|uniref:ABC transporter permease subunit n=1 Tax=Paraliobacillus sediminis TaxID=1885916 RepID=UPI000E3CF6D4|nr:ABC transporter permease subunit [Paraliobacillus sediminis]
MKYGYQLVKGLGAHLKNPKFLIGFLTIFGILVVSIGHSIIQEEPVRQYVLVYDEDGGLVSSKPHPPSKYVPMGSDLLGYSISDQLITGAKYTILFASGVALLRILVGFLFAIPYVFMLNNKWRRMVEKLVDGFHYLPLTVLAIVLLAPFVMGSTGGFEYSLTERILVQGLILTILVVPLLTVLIGNEMRLILGKEFINGARVLGASNRQIIKKHVMPHLSARLGLIFGQQFIQVLVLLMHLGLFGLFLGGTSVMFDEVYKAPKHSVTFEWSGLISNAREAFMTGHYWIVVPVFIAFMVVIIAMQLIVQGIQEVQQRRVGVGMSRRNRNVFKRKTKATDNSTKVASVKPEDFHFL